MLGMQPKELDQALHGTHPALNRYLTFDNDFNFYAFRHLCTYYIADKDKPTDPDEFTLGTGAAKDGTIENKMKQRHVLRLLKKTIAA